MELFSTIPRVVVTRKMSFDAPRHQAPMRPARAAATDPRQARRAPPCRGDDGMGRYAVVGGGGPTSSLPNTRSLFQRYALAGGVSCGIGLRISDDVVRTSSTGDDGTRVVDPPLRRAVTLFTIPVDSDARAMHDGKTRRVLDVREGGCVRGTAPA
jgi:hypothetical protein